MFSLSRSIGLMKKGGEIWEPEGNVCQVCCVTDLPRVKEKKPGFYNNVWCDLIVYDHTKLSDKRFMKTIKCKSSENR